MTGELRALREALRGTGFPCEIGDATGHMPPFLVVWGPAGLRDDDEAMTGSCGSHKIRGGVTCTAQDAEAAGDLAALVVELLAPSKLPTTVPSSNGRHLVIDLYDVRPAEVDRTVTLPSTNTHPAFSVVLFDLWSHPLQGAPDVAD